jgi:hypothetical protein
MKNIVPALLFCLLQSAASVHGQDASSYVIIGDIGSYLIAGDPAVGKGPGVLAGPGHFDQDHTDITAEIDYYNLQSKVGPEVQVTKHAGVESDKWLLHEVEDSYRSDDPSRLGLLSQGTVLRTMTNDVIFSIRLGGGSYMWISNNVVVRISYRGIQGGKPEPLEVIQAYLQKFPSTVPATLVLDKAHDVQWIKDEMDRRLWLCDKWFMQLQLKKAEERQVYQESVESMNIFLDYREKYFAMKAADEKNLLAGYLYANNGTGIKAKLTEYKNWWSVHKNDAISIP